jgi:hypothetical protein
MTKLRGMSIKNDLSNATVSSCVYRILKSSEGHVRDPRENDEIQMDA